MPGRTLWGLFGVHTACRPPSFWGLPSECTRVSGCHGTCWPTGGYVAVSERVCVSLEAYAQAPSRRAFQAP